MKTEMRINPFDSCITCKTILTDNVRGTFRDFGACKCITILNRNNYEVIYSEVENNTNYAKLIKLMLMLDKASK